MKKGFLAVVFTALALLLAGCGETGKVLDSWGPDVAKLPPSSCKYDQGALLVADKTKGQVWVCVPPKTLAKYPIGSTYP